ncbi:MAG: potassium-transporting ATPase subunit KdpA [Deltaproteobacteria bacterium]|nr:potassium-transporting ATPase subunit KdpA [Deltaproteobacteria bacterium]
MTASTLLLDAVYFALLIALGVPLGRYVARVFAGEARVAQRILGPLERVLYRLSGVRPDEEMGWKRYALSLLAFNLLGLLAVYALERLQGLLPLNPTGMGAVPSPVAFNTAVSFATNTNWQSYGGETTMSHLTQMLALTVQNFVSAATGIALVAALARGFVRKSAETIGNFWVDLTRSTLYVLLPLSLVLAVFLVSQGVVQTFNGSVTVATLDPAAPGAPGVGHQTLALGPVASQLAIKQLGTNGGGFYNVNSAHPFENPTAWSNFLELFAILIIPAALCFTWGALVKHKRLGWVLIGVMAGILIPLVLVASSAEQAGNPALRPMGVDDAASVAQSGGNMEGKEVRFGIGSSALWAAATTAASNGSVNSMHDSYMPLGGMAPLWLMQLGEVVFGGVGSGLYGLLMFAIIAVFLAGLMVGRTPEFLGKKLEAFEMKMAALVVLLPSMAVLIGTAIGSLVPQGTGTVLNPGAHGFSEILYAFSSTSNNNGSAFAGLGVTNVFYSAALGLCMLFGRYWVIVPVLAVAGALARKNLVPATAGTLPSDTPLFALLLAGTVLLVGALTFVPALALGPIVEHLQLHP